MADRVHVQIPNCCNVSVLCFCAMFGLSLELQQCESTIWNCELFRLTRQMERFTNTWDFFFFSHVHLGGESGHPKHSERGGHLTTKKKPLTDMLAIPLILKQAN